MGLCQAILIDPATRTVKSVETDGAPSNVRFIVGATALDNFRIDSGSERCWDYGWFDMARASLAGMPPAFRAAFAGYRIIPGRCLIIGTDKATGGPADASLDHFEVQRGVEWLSAVQF